ncbi:MAG: hypothetical protein KDA93_16615 [Planctomycetaceae bacterium]|nr:hypothetical protein [Planctomycetaceae bacterium]
MWVSRCWLERVIVAGLLCLVVGCGAQEKGSQEFTAVPSDDVAAAPIDGTPSEPTLAEPSEFEPTPVEPTPAINDEPEVATIEIIEPIEEAAVVAVPEATTESLDGAKLSTDTRSSRPRIKGAVKFDTSNWQPPGVSYNSTKQTPEEVPVVEPESEVIADIPIIEPLNSDPIPTATPSPEESPIARVDELVSKLKSGNIAYNAPDSMHYKETRIIELLLSPKESPQLLEAQLTDRRDAVSEQVQHVAPRMEASLTGTGFEIEPLEPDIQLISSLRPTKWRWRVTPSHYGQQELNLSLSAHLDLEGGGEYVIDSLNRVIDVEITLKEQVAEYVTANWQWLWGTLILPIVGLRMKYGRKRRRNDEWDERDHHDDHDRMAA